MCERCGKVRILLPADHCAFSDMHPSRSVIPVLWPDIDEFIPGSDLTNVLMPTVRKPLPDALL